MATNIKVSFNGVFKSANFCRRRYRCMKGSAGSGKSVNVVQDYILKLGDPKYKGAGLMCVRKIKDTHLDSCFAELLGAINRIFGDNAKLFWRVTYSPMRMVSLITGNEIIFRGMKDFQDREKIKSVTMANGCLCWIWCEEASELSESDVDILDDRLRGILPNDNLFYQITFTFNPIYRDHWLKRNYFDVAASDADVFCHHSTYLDNRFVDEAYFRRMERRKVTDPEGYKVYGLGDWGNAGGQFFTMFSELTHVIKPFKLPDNWSRIRSGDWGSAAPYAFLWGAVDYDNNLYVYRELYGYGGKPNVGTRETAAEVGRKIVKIEKENINLAVLDSACWADVGTGKTVANDINIELARNFKMPFLSCDKGRAQMAEQVTLRLTGDGDKPSLFIFSNCVHLIRTLPNLAHDKVKVECVDTHGEDHLYDSLGYMCLQNIYTPRPKKSGYRCDDAYAKAISSTSWEAE